MATQNGTVTSEPIIASAPVLPTDDLAVLTAGLEVVKPEPVASADRSELTVTIDDFQATLVNNGRAVAADAQRYSVNGKATVWDGVLLAMLKQPKGAELLIRPMIVVNQTTGVPAPRYATSKVKAARDRIADGMAHYATRIRIERLTASVGTDGATTYGPLLVTVTPANKR
jgi:hypothetical protein